MRMVCRGGLWLMAPFTASAALAAPADVAALSLAAADIAAIEQTAEPAAAPVASVQPAALPREKALTFIVSPYVWIPSVSGNIGVGNGGLAFDLKAGDLLKVFQFGGLIRSEVRHKSGWGLAVDHIFADLGTGVSIAIGDVDADIDANVTEVALVRRIDSRRAAIDLYAGMRNWDVDVDVTLATPFFNGGFKVGEGWVDPIVGVRYQRDLSRKWKLLAQADVGGFGVGSDFSWNVAAGASLALSRRSSLQFVYRALAVDRESPGLAGPNPVTLDIAIQGPLIGFAHRF